MIRLEKKPPLDGTTDMYKFNRRIFVYKELVYKSIH